MTHLESIQSKAYPFALVKCSGQDFDKILFPDNRHTILVPESKDLYIKLIRGKRCSTTERLFQELAAAFQLFYGFGENWDAFDDCMYDLGQTTSANSWVFAFSDINKLLAQEDTKELDILFSLLSEGSKNWARTDTTEQKKVTFSIILQLEENTEVSEKLKSIISDRQIPVVNIED